MNNISFIIPVYNQEKYITEFLENLGRIEIPDYEIVCVDDGSTDGTADCLDEAAAGNRRIRVFHIENHGPGFARNYGVEHSRGAYIAFCDSDDRIYLDVYKKMYEKISAEKKDLIAARYREVYDSGKTVEHAYTFHNENDSWSLLQHIAVYAKIFSREFIEKNHISFPEYYQGEDRVFLGKVSVAGPQIIWIDENCYDYLRHEQDDETTLSHSFNYRSFEHRVKCWTEFYHICSPAYPVKIEEYILERMDYIYRMWTKLPPEKNQEGLALVRKLLSFALPEYGDYVVFALPLREFMKKTDYIEYAEAVIRESLDCEVISHEKVQNPAVSVIIPMYNAGRYLRECLQSLVEQTFEEFEVICVDDGSEDNTIEIVREYMTFDKRIRLMRQKHAMAGTARNLGMTEAQGEYYLFLDADDFFAPEMLEKSVKKVREDGADICLFDIWQVYGDEKVKKEGENFLKKDYVPDQIPFEGKKYPYIFNLTTASPWNKLIKKSLVDKYQIQFMPLPRCNDIYFSFLIMAVAEKITILEERLLYYRQSGGSLQATKAKSPCDWYTALAALKEKLKELRIFEDVEQSFMNCVLSISMYNLFSIKDPDVFGELWKRLREEILEALGLTTYDISKFYPHNKDNVDKLLYIMENSAETYLFCEIKKLTDLCAERRKQMMGLRREGNELRAEIKKQKTEIQNQKHELRKLTDQKKKVTDEKNKLIKEKENWKKRANEFEKKWKDTRNSTTFKIGKAIVYIPRKLKNILLKFRKM